MATNSYQFRSHDGFARGRRQSGIARVLSAFLDLIGVFLDQIKE
jgi:hypothetical protein